MRVRLVVGFFGPVGGTKRLPTATQVVPVGSQETPASRLAVFAESAKPLLALGTTVQVVPFQDSARVLSPLPPTAAQLVPVTQVTPLSRLSSVAPLLGLRVMDQELPFQVSIRVRAEPVVRP